MWAYITNHVARFLGFISRDFDSANLWFSLESAFLLSILGDSDTKGLHELTALKTILLTYLLNFLSTSYFELLCFFLLLKIPFTQGTRRPKERTVQSAGCVWNKKNSRHLLAILPKFPPSGTRWLSGPSGQSLRGF